MGIRMVGVDIGGTFTDIVMVDTENKSVRTVKVPTTRPNTSEGVAKGLGAVLSEGSSSVSHLVLGSTTGTNAVIERKGAVTALMVTEGFGDILYIGRQQRPSLYDFFADKVRPLIEGDLICEVSERMLPDGTTLRPLTDKEIRRIMQWLDGRNVESLAICFLHSYVNPSHEQALARAIQRAHQGMLVSVSADIAPEPREYERCSTTVVDAYIKPVMLREISGVADVAANFSIPRVLVMQSNAGVLPSETMHQVVVGTLTSGPAGGVKGAIAVLQELGQGDFLTLDMGGTSADIAVVQQYKPGVRYEWEIAGSRGRWAPTQTGMPVRMPVLDVISIGAGGGSLAEVSSQRLHVGPESAGSIPGPACYGQGNLRPTVTDANVALNRLPGVVLEHHGLFVQPDLAPRAVQEHIASPLGLSLEEAALGIIKVVNTNMALGIRRVSVVRGLDPRAFPLVAFGGAGPMHAAEIARELGLSTVIVPLAPGTLSALGLVSSGYQRDFAKAIRTGLSEEETERLFNILISLEKDGREAFPVGALPELEEERFDWTVEARYLGQGHSIPVQLKLVSNALDLKHALMEAFHVDHQARYGFARSGSPIEVTTVRVSHVVRFKHAFAAQWVSRQGRRQEQEMKVVFDRGPIMTPVVDRSALRPSGPFKGPAVIVEETSTTVVPPGCWWRVVENGCLIIDVKEK